VYLCQKYVDVANVHFNKYDKIYVGFSYLFNIIINVPCIFFQPPIVVLHVTVVEAEGLEAKDANGK